jgi:hypothetical protein
MRVLLVLAALLTVAVLPGCTTDFGIKGGQGVDINPFNLGSGDSVFSPSNSRWFSDGEPLDCRSHH